MRRTLIAMLAGTLLAMPGTAGARAASEVRVYADSHRREIVREFLDLVAMPDVENDVPALNRNAARIAELARGRGLAVETWQTSNGIPVVFAERRVPGATRTILLYAHYDGQPVNAAEWHQPDPFRPVVRTDAIERGGRVVSDLTNASFPDGWRVYARAAGDDKAPIQAIFSALDAIGSKPRHNIKIYFDGQEEAGGPGIGEVVARHRDRLKADVMVMLDGPQHASGRTTVFYGSRGEAGLDVTVHTARQGQHSGNYGNFLPDANVRLAQLVASMVEPGGRVAINDFYADVPPFTAADKAMFAAVPDVGERMRVELGIGRPDGVAPSLQEALNLPAFSVHTLDGGEVGNVIPASAHASISLRLVRENDRATMLRRITDHIRAQGYHVVTTAPDKATLVAWPRLAQVTPRAMPDWLGSDPWRTDPEHPQVRAVTDALRSVWGDDVVRLRTLGGTLPAAGFIKGLGVPVVGVSIANYDDNQHAADENLRLGNLFDGIVTIAAIMTR